MKKNLSHKDRVLKKKQFRSIKLLHPDGFHFKLTNRYINKAKNEILQTMKKYKKELFASFIFGLPLTHSLNSDGEIEIKCQNYFPDKAMGFELWFKQWEADCE